MRFSTKLALLVSAPVITLCGIGFYATHVTSIALRHSIEESERDKAQAIIDEIDRSIHARISDWQAYSQSSLVQETLTAANERRAALEDPSDKISEIDDLWQDDSLDEFRSSLLENPLSADLRLRMRKINEGLPYPVYGEVFLTDEFGANVAQSHQTTDYRQDDETWWKRAVQTGVYVGPVDFDMSARVYSTDLCIRIDDRNGAFIGVLKAVLNVNDEIKLLDARISHQDDVEHTMLVTRDKRLLHHSRLRTTPLTDASHLLDGIELEQVNLATTLYREDPRPGERLFTTVACSRGYGRNPGVGWFVIIDESFDKAFAPIVTIRNAALLLGGIGLLLTFLPAILTVRSISKRIEDLTRAAKQVGQGELGTQVASTGHDELASLAESFNTMSMSLERQAESLRAQANELREAERLAIAANLAKGAFLANMSHEIRTPMTAILGYADMLLSEGDIERAPPERIEAIQTIRRNGEHLLTIINDILDFSKIEAGKLEIDRVAVDPIRIVEEVVSLMHVRAKQKQLTLDVEWKGPLPRMIQGDPVRMRQVLINLVGNAIKFTDCGSVTITTSFISNPTGEPFIQYDVKDTGIGLTQEQIEKLFQSFSQADSSMTRKHGGTGLGLTISKRLTEMMGGQLTVESIPGKGSTFSARIDAGQIEGVAMVNPNLQIEANSRSEDRQIDQSQQLTGCRVLLVEDGPDNQKLIAFLLRKSGAEVLVVENGKLAIESLTNDGTIDGDLRHPPGFDVILMDMQMPVMDGYTAAGILRDRGNRIPVIALTAHALNAERKKCLDAGCDEYATKPIDRKKLILTVARMVKRSQTPADAT